MKFEWDPVKAVTNQAKHGIPFARAVLVFSDPERLEEVDCRKDYGERRRNTIGRLDAALIVCVTHTDRNGVTRLISVRNASRAERKRYHHGKNNQNDT